MSNWQPIDTAPKDGTQFQAWCKRIWPPEDVLGWWEPVCRYDEHGAFQIYGRVDYDMEGFESLSHIAPTHWMPPPEPPK